MAPGLNAHAQQILSATHAFEEEPRQRSAVPAPEVYELLGDISAAISTRLPDALERMADSLERSFLVDYDVYEDDGTDPAQSIHAARQALSTAILLLRDAGDSLDHARIAMRNQGYRSPRTSP